MTNYHYHQSSAWRPTILTVAITSITVTSSYCIYSLVSQYGWEGTFWYIWEGDPYPPNVRGEFHALDQVEDDLQKETRVLDRLEEAYQRALLDSVDGAEENTLVELWNNNLPKRNLDKLMARVSYNLDQLAAKVDAVPSQKHVDLKARKKQLSTKIVGVMQRADVYVGHDATSRCLCGTLSRGATTKTKLA